MGRPERNLKSKEPSEDHRSEKAQNRHHGHHRKVEQKKDVPKEDMGKNPLLKGERSARRLLNREKSKNLLKPEKSKNVALKPEKTKNLCEMGKNSVLKDEVVKNHDENERYKRKMKIKEPLKKCDVMADIKDILRRKRIDLKNLIGTGSYSEVYKAVQIDFNKLVAVKIIDLSIVNENYRANFLPNEISIIRKLNHRSVVKVFNISQIFLKVIIVMEFAPRGTMSDLVAEKGALNEPISTPLYGLIMHGLEHMHSQRIAHRDLKLENILLTERNMPKIADFSFSLQWDEKTLCQDYCGSVPYFAPELLEMKPYNPFFSDVWSMGICLFITTNDRFPFNQNLKEDQILKLQKTKAFKFRVKTDKEYSEEYKDLVHRMLEPEVSKRTNIKAALSHGWMANFNIDYL